MGGDKSDKGNEDSDWLGGPPDEQEEIYTTSPGVAGTDAAESSQSETPAVSDRLPPVDLESRLDKLELHLIPYIPMRPLANDSMERLADALDQLFMNDDPGHAREYWDFNLSDGDSDKLAAIADNFSSHDIVDSMLDVMYQKAVQVLGPHGNEDERMMMTDTLFSLKRRAQTTGYKADYTHKYTPEERNEMRIRAWEAAKRVFDAIPQDSITRRETTSLARIGKLLAVPEPWYHQFRDVKCSEEEIENYKRISITPTLADYVLESGEWIGLIRDADNMGLSSEQIIDFMIDTEYSLLKNKKERMVSGEEEGFNPKDPGFIKKVIRGFVDSAVRYAAIIYCAAHYDGVSKLSSIKEHLGYVSESSAPAVKAEQVFMTLFERLKKELKVKVKDVDYGYFTRKGYKEYKRIIDREDPDARKQHELIMHATSMRPEEVMRYAASRGFVKINDMTGEDLIARYSLSEEKIPVILFLPVAKNGKVRYQIYEDPTALVSSDGRSYYVELDSFDQFVFEDGLLNQIAHEDGVRSFEIDLSDMETMIFTKKDYIDQKKASLEKKAEAKKPEVVPIHLSDMDEVTLNFLKKWGFESRIYSTKRLVTPRELYEIGVKGEGYLYRKGASEAEYLAFPVLHSLGSQMDGLGENDHYTKLLVVRVGDKNKASEHQNGALIPVHTAALFEKKDLQNARGKYLEMRACPSGYFRAKGSGEGYISVGFNMFGTTGPSAWLQVEGKRLPINFLPFGAMFTTADSMYAISSYNPGDLVTNPKGYVTGPIDTLAEGDPVDLKVKFNK